MVVSRVGKYIGHVEDPVLHLQTIPFGMILIG
jgi:hypothetical protein